MLMLRHGACVINSPQSMASPFQVAEPHAKAAHDGIHRMALTRVLAAVIERNDTYLVCQRPGHKRHGSLWEFPGGKLELGETYLEAARRELAEELAVDVLAVGAPLFSIADPGSEFLIEFVPTTISGDPRCLEHIALRWMSLADLPSLPLAPSDRSFVEFLRSTRVGESSLK